MLASLLPGLRDVRTPLTVGYMWLAFLWMIGAGAILDEIRASESYTSHLLDTVSGFGSVAVVGVISLAAYLIGILLTVNSDNRVVSRMSSIYFTFARWSRRDVATDFEYRRVVEDQFATADEIVQAHHHQENERSAKSKNGFAAKLSNDIFLMHTRIERLARGGDQGYLRPRLLIANQELYSEYDRLSAEATFRINVPLPLVVLTTVFSTDLGWWLLPLGFSVAVSLLISGLHRLNEAETTIRRAVLDDLIVHPLTDSLEQLRKMVSNYQSIPLPPSLKRAST